MGWLTVDMCSMLDGPGIRDIVWTVMGWLVSVTLSKRFEDQVSFWMPSSASESDELLFIECSGARESNGKGVSVLKVFVNLHYCNLTFA